MVPNLIAWCDNEDCDATFEGESSYIVDVASAMVDEGWKVDILNNGTLCPEHRE